MTAIFKVSKYTLLENARSRSFTLSIIFVLLVFVSAFIFSRLSEVVETRVIQDIGLGAIQFFSLITAIFFAIKVSLIEIQNKTIYLPLTRPVKRWEYIGGRFIGICLSVLLEILAMGFLLTLLLIWKKANLSGFYFITYFFIFLKIMTITAVAILISLVSTSQVSAFIVSFLIWLGGHILGEVEFLVQKLPLILVTIVKIFKWIFPNYMLLNAMDYQEKYFYEKGSFLPAIGYAFFYAICVMFIASGIFKKKEM